MDSKKQALYSELAATPSPRDYSRITEDDKFDAEEFFNLYPEAVNSWAKASYWLRPWVPPRVWETLVHRFLATASEEDIIAQQAVFSDEPSRKALALWFESHPESISTVARLINFDWETRKRLLWKGMHLHPEYVIKQFALTPDTFGTFNDDEWRKIITLAQARSPGFVLDHYVIFKRLLDQTAWNQIAQSALKTDRYAAILSLAEFGEFETEIGIDEWVKILRVSFLISPSLQKFRNLEKKVSRNELKDIVKEALSSHIGTESLGEAFSSSPRFVVDNLEWLKDLADDTLLRKICASSDLSYLLKHETTFVSIESDWKMRLQEVLERSFLTKFLDVVTLFLETEGSLVYDALQAVLVDAIEAGYGISVGDDFLNNYVAFFNRLRSLAKTPSAQERLQQLIRVYERVYSDIPAAIAYSESLSPADKIVMTQYSRSSAMMNEPAKRKTYTDTQRYLAAARRRPTREQQHNIVEMDRLLRDAPKTRKPLFVWRGVALPSFDAADHHLEIFKSVSLSPAVALDYMRHQQCCLMRVLIPAGVPMLSLDLVQLDYDDGGLFEFVLPRGAVFKHVDTKKISGQTIYDCNVEFDQSYNASLAPGRLRHRPY